MSSYSSTTVNLGSLSELELGRVAAEARRALGKSGIQIVRLLSGSFVTSLNMPGFSIIRKRYRNSLR
ncbi:hypothetical protein M405DRAFT_866923 [Rhizopogon salebrosus TDB-379]|nr:hypothetical protein M405DRAFT_866923 [Rhizopogon salebrosus TDB-379]